MSYESAMPHQTNPMTMATIDDTKDNFWGISGRWKNCPARLVPSPISVVVSVMTPMVPRAYANKNDKFPLQVATASAGAKEGAPSQENPCSNPLNMTALFCTDLIPTSVAAADRDCGWTPSISDSHSLASLIPMRPIMTRDRPTAISVTEDARVNIDWREDILAIRLLRKNAVTPRRVAETPWPMPHSAPTLPARYQRWPQHLGSNAAKWSGPVVGCANCEYFHCNKQQL